MGVVAGLYAGKTGRDIAGQWVAIDHGVFVLVP